MNNVNPYLSMQRKRSLNTCAHLLFAVLLGSLISCSTLKSDLTIQPGKQFILGGNQDGAFTVNLRNVGNVSVTVTERKEKGDPESMGQFAPGEQKTLRFSRRTAVLINNAASQPARLFLVVSGDKDLNMQSQ
jgi:hypothetical protein